MKIRVTGLVLLGLCAFAAWRLRLLVIVPPRHEATMVEFLLGAMAFLCGSVGAAMTALGRGLFGQIPAPPRLWHFDLRDG